MRTLRAVVPLSLALTMSLSGCSYIPFLNDGDADQGAEVISESGMTIDAKANIETSVLRLVKLADNEEFAKKASNPFSMDAKKVSLKGFEDEAAELVDLVAADEHFFIISGSIMKMFKDSDIRVSGVDAEAFAKGYVLHTAMSMPSSDEVAGVIVEPDGFELRNGIWYQKAIGAITLVDGEGRLISLMSPGMGGISFSEDGSRISLAIGADTYQLYGTADAKATKAIKPVMNGLKSIMEIILAEYGEPSKVEADKVIANAPSIIDKAKLKDGLEAEITDSGEGNFRVTVRDSTEGFAYDSTFSMMGVQTGMMFPESFISDGYTPAGQAWSEMAEEHSRLAGAKDKKVEPEALVNALTKNKQFPDTTWTVGDAEGGSLIAGTDAGDIEIALSAVTAESTAIGGEFSFNEEMDLSIK